ncbi:isopentenyl-diphosphate Delta-isomerase [Actinoplanes sp. NEAU-A12]|uniref:Isopentenyl-diphosphate Delta-isomerase n=1 Tax=Actinoplanes sandaracinus TaxID=3045177 RepID=A0ABT6WWT3_9ACTN|nr:isopentenyl-diphosphate Delta-isomerase [Actinoplanes sandaracinus]MDI6104185.1 isopentenyl-diphosphate Delta-isomerase [Actinoplanes sandaracinus]
MEHVILLNESGEARGLADKRTVHTDATPLHLAFSCYIFDAAGRFLISQRALHKKTWPGIWTNSVCGHPQEGEPIVDAVHRRAAFELGITLKTVRLVLPAFRYRAELHGVVENEMCPVFHATADSDPRPHPDEVAATRWLPWSDFVRDVKAAPDAYSPWCGQQIEQLTALGPTPDGWPSGDPALLPPAAHTAVR